MAQQARPPVITIMGHVDHGKTTLLDYIRKTNVTAKEAGGITQHIGAYSIQHEGKPLTFIDTPGHAAFNKMRERGAKVTDIVILVVAANDGVKPQTIESIRHIKNSKVPVLVAINKIDIKEANPDLAKSGLVEHELVVTDYGGDIESVEISAKTGKNVDKLLETLTAMADLLELKADPTAPLEAVVIESSLDRHRGSVATVIVQQGTLQKRQDVYSIGEDGETEAEGRVKLLADATGGQLAEVLPGFPAEIVGFNDVPSVGSRVRDNAAEYAEKEVEDAGTESDTSSEEDQEADLDGYDFAQLLADEDKPKLKLVLKADVEGTLEAILQNIDDESVDLLDYGVGEVTERDLELARASNSLIVAFHTRVSNKIKKLAKIEGVKIKQYDIIYQLIEDLQKQMLKLIEPTIDEVQLGEAEILEIFEIKNERIAGSRVKTGEMKKSDLFHLVRDGEIIANPVVKSMMHGKQEIDKVTAKSEFGVTFKNKKLDFKVGDHLVAYKIEEEI